VADASIVDQDIEPTFGSRNLLDRGLDLGLFSYIKLLSAFTPPGSSNFTGNPLSSIPSYIGENDVRTLLCKESCDLLSDAGPSTRYEGDFLI
jgi:hypothetical protein